MKRIIKAMEEKYRQPSLDMVQRTFTNSETSEDAQIVVDLIEEIRARSTTFRSWN